MLFGCVGAAGRAQEEEEVCEGILQGNVVLITPFGSSGIPPPYIRLSTRQNASFRRIRQSPPNQVPTIANLGTIIISL